MADGWKRSKRLHREGSAPASFGRASTKPSNPLLVTVTDIFFWITLTAVAAGLGGRMAMGQMALVVGSSATALCWLVHLLTTSKPRYTWTGCEWMLCLGILVGIAQIVPIPFEILAKISPQTKDILPLWFDSKFESMFSARWNQLSLNPWESTSGLATFVSYSLLFVVAAQRIRTLKDVERNLCFVAISAVAMMLFAQLQLHTSNGKFFWTYEHPFITTYSYPLGCFTNRNHLAQFLVLGTGPLIWWLLRRFHQQEADQAKQRAIPRAMHIMAIVLLLTSLAGISLTVLMTLSRGGLMALALATVVAIGLMLRIGLASFRFCIALAFVGITTIGLFSYSTYESIMTTRLQQKSGRSDIWQANLQVARDFPLFGTGIGTHVDAYHLHLDSRGVDGLEYTHAESGYLQVASESGLAGLIVAGLLIAISLWWCIGSLRNADSKVASAAAAILGSLIANVAHAAVDFFWYTPICILILAVQLACASCLYRSTRQSAGASEWEFPFPRFATSVAICGLAAIAAWMVDLKQPVLMAEPHHIESILLSQLSERDLSEDEKTEANQRRLKETFLAAKRNPRSALLQENAAMAYVQLFELKQTTAENAMSASMIRDTVKGSQFENMTDTEEWLKRAVGTNLKLLSLAMKSTKRAIANCPLRAKSYILLTEIDFLEQKDDEVFHENCLKQALKIRPYDADTLYLVGKSALQNGDLEKALTYWRPAFERSPRNRERISELLAIEVSPEFFEKEFHPDWQSLDVIGQAFAKANRDPEAQQVRRAYIQKAMSHIKKIKSDDELETALFSVRNACRAIGDNAAAINTLKYAAKRLPHTYSVRYWLGLDLIESHNAAEAAPHLKWCSAQNPQDQNLQRLVTQAVSAQLRTIR